MTVEVSNELKEIEQRGDYTLRKVTGNTQITFVYNIETEIELASDLLAIMEKYKDQITFKHNKKWSQD